MTGCRKPWVETKSATKAATEYKWSSLDFTPFSSVSPRSDELSGSSLMVCAAPPWALRVAVMYCATVARSELVASSLVGYICQPSARGELALKQVECWSRILYSLASLMLPSVRATKLVSLYPPAARIGRPICHTLLLLLYLLRSSSLCLFIHLVNNSWSHCASHSLSAINSLAGSRRDIIISVLIIERRLQYGWVLFGTRFCLEGIVTFHPFVIQLISADGIVWNSTQVMARVFRKCKSATFQIGTETYTIGKFDGEIFIGSLSR